MSDFIGDIIGQAVPAPKPGKKLQQLNRDGSKVSYSDADFSDLDGKVTAIYYIAAQSGTDKLQEKLKDAIDAEGFSADDFLCLTVINVDDAMFGTAGLAKSTFEGRSKEPGNADREFWVDSKSVLRDRWELDKKSAAHIILGKDGTVLSVVEGKVTDDEVAETIAAIKSGI